MGRPRVPQAAACTPLICTSLCRWRCCCMAHALDSFRCMVPTLSAICLEQTSSSVAFRGIPGPGQALAITQASPFPTRSGLHPGTCSQAASPDDSGEEAATASSVSFCRQCAATSAAAHAETIMLYARRGSCPCQQKGCLCCTFSVDLAKSCLHGPGSNSDVSLAVLLCLCFSCSDVVVKRFHQMPTLWSTLSGYAVLLVVDSCLALSGSKAFLHSSHISGCKSRVPGGKVLAVSCSTVVRLAGCLKFARVSRARCVAPWDCVGAWALYLSLHLLEDPRHRAQPPLLRGMCLLSCMLALSAALRWAQSCAQTSLGWLCLSSLSCMLALHLGQG
jgi:hypothetical protein